jgi:hypothetical protein
MTGSSILTLSRLLWVANCARLIGSMTLGVGVASHLHDALQLNGPATNVLAIVLFLCAQAAKMRIARTSLWDAEQRYYRRNLRGMLVWAIVESILWVTAGVAVAGVFLSLSTVVPSLNWVNGRGMPIMVVGLCLLIPALWFTVSVFTHPPELLHDDRHRRGCRICALILHSYRLPE